MSELPKSPELIEDWLETIFETINLEKRAANHTLTWTQVCNLYVGQTSEKDSPLHQAFKSGQFINKSGVVVCREAYLDGWISAYYKQKKLLTERDVETIETAS